MKPAETAPPKSPLPVVVAEPAETPREATIDFARSLATQTLIGMKAAMRDPGSTRFQDVYTVNLGDDDERLILVCGRVTGRNGFGGYTGLTPFVSSGSDVRLEVMPGFSESYQGCIDGKPVTPIHF